MLRIIAAVFLIVSAQYAAAEDLERRFVSAAELYEYIDVHIYPPLPSDACRPLLRKVLHTLESLDVGEPKRAFGNWSDKKLLSALRAHGCVSRNFRVWTSLPPLIPGMRKYPSLSFSERCDIGSLKEVGGYWRLELLEEDDRDSDPAHECPYTASILYSFAEQLRWGDIPMRSGRSYVLDLQGNVGGRVKQVLNMFFSPASDTPGFGRKYRKNGAEADETWMTGTTGVLPCPRAILVDNGTGSGGEIIAEVVRGWCPATPVLGQLTYGKGAGTRWLRVGEFTVAVPEDIYLFFPDGHTIDGRGVIPDVFLSERTPEARFAAALAYVRCNAPGAFRERQHN